MKNISAVSFNFLSIPKSSMSEKSRKIMLSYPYVALSFFFLRFCPPTLDLGRKSVFDPKTYELLILLMQVKEKI